MTRDQVLGCFDDTPRRLCDVRKARRLSVTTSALSKAVGPLVNKGKLRRLIYPGADGPEYYYRRKTSIGA